MSAGDVFIVDDNPNNLSLLAGILRGAGYRVRMANAPGRALGMIQTLPPELIMMDVAMPEMDGYELCREVKARPETADVPVIFLSALSEPLDKVRAFEAGGVDYVTKPFDAAEILARLDCQLKLRRIQRELAEKNRELAHLNELKNRFLGMAAHDLRSPLTVVLAFAELLESDSLDDQQRQAIATIRRTGEFMLRLVNDLLDLSAIEAGQLRLDLSAVDVVALVETAVDLNRRLAVPKGISLELRAAPEPLTAWADPARIQQVLNNLIGNALKFSKPGTTVEVEVARLEAEARVSVADEGPGIPAAELERLFEPFRRGAAKATGGEKSTGLGLAIVRRIIAAHGGRIWAESEPERGARFHFTVPLEPPSSEEP